MSFLWPHFLWLMLALPVLPAVYLWLLGRRRKSALRYSMTMMVVTHEMGFAREVADRVIFIDRGRIVEQGAPRALLSSPQHERTQDFLRRVTHPM